MSAILTGRVWQTSRIPSASKFVLLALADQANDAGMVEIGLAGLRTKTGLNRDAIRYALNYLIENSYIARVRPNPEAIEEKDSFRICLVDEPWHGGTT